MKNNLADLNNHLFSMLEELNSDEQMNQEDFDKLIKKSKSNKLCFNTDIKSCKSSGPGNKNCRKLWTS